jgi:uncharacterized Zn finger protein (UPF0148 family)
MSQKSGGNLVELKYCEGCGCLLTRPVGSGLTFCSICESKQSANRFLTPPKRRSARPARLPKGIHLRAGISPGVEVDPDVDWDLGVCA